MTRHKQSATAYDKAVSLLGIRMHTSFELGKKLKQKGFSPQEVDEAILRLKEERYLKDEDTAQIFLENLMRYKTFGYYGLKMKLMQKGIANDIIENLLSEHLTLEAETEIAKKALGKSSKVDPVKLMMMLKRKGFRGQVINRVTRQNVDDE